MQLNVAGAAGGGPAPLGRWRVSAASVLAALGLAAAAAGFLGDEQRLTFDRTAWRAVPLDEVFPPVYHTVAGDATQGATRD
jgi:hypothetical protein